MLVTRLDQLARSTRDLLNTLDAIAKAGAGCRSNGESWANTTTAHGRLVLAVLGGLAEFERELIRARTGDQVAVSLSVANHTASLPIAYQLYLPEEWAGDAARRAQTHVPEIATFQTKPEIALKQIKTALEAGVSAGVVLADAGYGVDAKFRSGLTALGLAYVVGVQSTLSVWPPGTEPLPPPPWAGRGRTPTRLRRDSEHQPSSAKQLAMNLPSDAWSEVTWREGTNDVLCSRFAAVRIRPASRDWLLDRPHSQEWLLIEWPTDEKEPTKYWLSTLPEDATLLTLVDMAKLRWRIERDYEELKSELGLSHFEGRGWRGFHHHATLCIAAYGFLIRERAAIPPLAPCSAKNLVFASVEDPANPPLRPERHVANSIATIRKRLAFALVKTLYQCPCCKAILPAKIACHNSS